MANENENVETTQGSGVARTPYRVTRTHEGPMGSLTEGYEIEIEDDDPRAKGMVDAGLIEKLNRDSEATQTTKRGTAKSGATGDRAAKNS